MKHADVVAQPVKALLWDRHHMQPNVFQPPSVWPKMRTLCTSVTPEWRSNAVREVVWLRGPPVIQSSYFILFLRDLSARSLSCKLSSRQRLCCLTVSGILPHFTVGQQRCGSRPSRWPSRRRWRCFPALERTFAEKSAAVKLENIHAAVQGGGVGVD